MASEAPMALMASLEAWATLLGSTVLEASMGVLASVASVDLAD